MQGGVVLFAGCLFTVAWPPFISLFLRLFLLSLSFMLVPFLKIREKAPTQEGHEVRVALLEHQLWPITAGRVHARYLLHAVWLEETTSGLEPTPNSTGFYCICILLLFIYFTLFVLIEKELGSCYFTLLHQANRKACSQTRFLCGIMITCSAVSLMFVQDASRI